MNSTALPFLTGLISLGLVFVTSVQAQTLSEAVRLMLAYEPELLAAHADTHSADEDVKIIRGNGLPHLTLSGEVGSVERDRSVDGLASGAGESLISRQIELSLRQLLFDGGQVLHQTRSAKHAHAMQNYLEKGMIEARAVDLAEVYMEILRSDYRVAEAQRNIDVHARIRQQVHERAGVGGTRADAGLVDGRLLSARDALVAQRLAHQRAQDRFERLVGKGPANLREPFIPRVPEDKEEVDLSQNWNYLSAEAALLATEDRKTATGRNRVPKFFFDAGASQGEDVLGVEGMDDELRALITMEWNLVTGGSNKAQIRREGWQVVRAHELLRASDLERNYRLTLLWREREGDMTAFSSLQTQVALLSQVANDYEDQFLVGKRDLIDILEIWNRYYEAKIRMVDAEYNLKTLGFRVLGVQGRLVEYLVGAEGGGMLAGSDKHVITEVDGHGPGVVAHPHHPHEGDSDSVHPMDAVPHEKWEFNSGEEAERGIFQRIFPHRHGGDPHAPKRKFFQLKRNRVSTVSHVDVTGGELAPVAD